MPAETVLRNAENNALKGADSQSYYSGTGRPESGKGSEKGKGVKKKRGGIYAMLLILMLLTGGGVMLGSSHSMLGPALSHHITTQVVDTGWAFNSSRYDKVLSDLAAGHRVDGALGSLKGVSNWVKTRLSTNKNFEVNGDSLSWKGQSLNGGNLANLAETNAEFRGDLEGAVGGRIISLQDNTNSNMYKTKFGVSGNGYKNFKSTGNTEADAASARRIAADQFEGKTTTRTTTTEDKTIKHDDRGNELNEETLDKNLTKNTSESTNTSTMTADKAQQANAYLNKITGRVSKAVNYACTALRLGSVVAATIAGVATYNYAREFLTNKMEPISKTMGGDGSQAPINELYNELTRPYPDSTIDDYSTAQATGTIGDDPSCSKDCNTQGDLSVSYSQHTYSGNLSAVEAPNLRANLTETAYNPTEGARNSLMTALEAVIASLAVLGVTSSVCIKAQAGLAAANLTLTVASVAISLIPGGQIATAAATTSVIWNAFFRWAVAFFAGAVLNFSISSFTRFLLPKLADTLFDNPTNATKGVPEGESTMAAASVVGSHMARRNNGGGLATKEEVLAYNKLNQAVIAREAEVDRLNRSPFDLSSPNTFFGSLAYSFFPMTLSSGIQPVNTLISATSSAVASLTNSASAASGERSSFMTTFGDYKYITEGFTESKDIAVDIYGNPIIINDLSMLDTPIDDPEYNKVINKYVTCNGPTCTINEGSDLEHYVDFCVNRDSPFGISDANILNALEYASSLPIIGDIVDLLNSIDYEENNEWATGKKCAASMNPEWDTKYKYFQLYVQDSRIAAQMGNTLPDENGVAYNNPVADRIAAYDAERDDEGSFTKYVARVSGITEEDASGIIAVAEYYRYLDSYDPDTRLAFGGESTTYETSAEIAAHFDTEEEIQTPSLFTQLATLYHQVIYADVRNRSYAV